MPLPNVEFHPAAAEEVAAAVQWYRERSEEAARALVAELDRAVAMIAEAPERWARYVKGTRRFLLRRFPFAVVYRQRQDVVEVVAVAHARRRPGYWRQR
ncbi:MAG: type II toxin-antitoxin system RelE/ParE family toxin [candidate division NC10 bacterium]|nr:type II toxin-antitoxin system RelE/ParE family toxin [candidate division NC10 bacterium]